MEKKFKVSVLSFILIGLIYLALTTRYTIQVRQDNLGVYKYDRWTGKCELLVPNRRAILLGQEEEKLLYLDLPPLDKRKSGIDFSVLDKPNEATWKTLDGALQEPNRNKAISYIETKRNAFEKRGVDVDYILNQLKEKLPYLDEPPQEK